jgi:hypothetical protein
MVPAVRRIVVTASLCIAMTVVTNAALSARSLGGEPLRDEGRAEITFTKWITITPGYPIMEGFSGGDAAGTFSGEVLENVVSTDKLVTRLVAVYEIHAGPHSFIALIEGGSDNQDGRGSLSGIVVSGWMRGANVQVRFKAIGCAQPNALNGICFQGTIRLTDSDDQ